MHMKGNIGNKEVKGRTSNPKAEKKEKDDEKITQDKEKRSSGTEETSSSESQSPVNRDSQRSRGVEVTSNVGNLGIQSNHGKEDIILEKVRLQEDQGGVGVSYETSAAVTENSKERNKGRKVVYQSKIEINWDEFLFKNKEAQKEISDGWASEVGLVNSGSKGPSAIEEGGVDKKGNGLGLES
ncbi:hypothetical protein V6N12_046278 [Hibiscus sabdariffa]|uniref:Uncharacterized protein n=1 Tax=Hibiscus sabdariffa TaxID=183260 RepID=A0ABR1ZIJ5_9ROSI